MTIKRAKSKIAVMLAIAAAAQVNAAIAPSPETLINDPSPSVSETEAIRGAESATSSRPVIVAWHTVCTTMNRDHGSDFWALYSCN